MKTNFEYVVKNIHTNDKHPGEIFTDVYDDSGLLISASLDYCIRRIKESIAAKTAETLTDRC
jgi:hypothetical protein